jgi:hypothetical protein
VNLIASSLATSFSCSWYSRNPLSTNHAHMNVVSRGSDFSAHITFHTEPLGIIPTILFACYHSVQNLLSSRLLSKNVKIIIYETIILPVDLYGCGTWSLTLREVHRLCLMMVILAETCRVFNFNFNF